MYLSQLKLWNFRKFGSHNEIILDNNLRMPDLDVEFNKGLNVLIGENDSGKTAIIDAIKIILKTHSFDWIRLELEDFYESITNLRIECIFKGLSDHEAKNFTEWLTIMDPDGNVLDSPELKVMLQARRDLERIFPFDVKAGADDVGHALTAEAREYLQTTYLKPLRDAKGELIPRKNSRLSQILQGHKVFKGKNNTHELVDIFRKFSDEVTDYFKTDGDKDGKEITQRIDEFLKDFFGEIKNAQFSVTNQKLKNILETLRLTLEDGRLGLGSHNLLFMASELLNLERTDWDGIRIGMIEELEAHLHPQAQLRIIEALQALEQKDIQFILTTHSPILGSKIRLENLILCEKNSGNTFSLRSELTKLKETDYRFLERFLDTTKANLFFAKGVILVEGWAEEILLPTLAKKAGYNLTEKGVSVVNVGSTAFLRYSRIFQRTKIPEMELPVSIITDLDVKPDKYIEIDPGSETEKNFDLSEKLKEKEEKYNAPPVKSFISPRWTLEYCIALAENLRKLFYKAVLMAIKEEKDYVDPKKIKIIDSIIDDSESHFDWDTNKEDIAFEIYLLIIGKKDLKIKIDLIEDDDKKVQTEIYTRAPKKISKSIIAQCFAQLLEDDQTITSDNLINDPQIKYLIDAIKYACSED